MSNLIEFLWKKDLLVHSGVNQDLISSLNPLEFIAINEEIEEIISKSQKNSSQNTFSFSASESLGGGALHCVELGCRRERLDRLARFALLYSDSVTIPSFFSTHTHLTDEVDFNDSLLRFSDDLSLVASVETAIKEGFISFFPTPMNICFTCQVGRVLGENGKKRFDKTYKNLQAQYLKVMNVICEKFEDGFEFTCEGPAPYFDHSNILICNGTIPELSARPRILKKIISGEEVVLSKTLTKDLALHIKQAHNAAANAIFGLSTAECLGTNFLTDNDIHINFLNGLHSNEWTFSRNQSLFENFSFLVPFLEDVSPNNLVTLRSREEDSFIHYRKALNNALGEVAKTSGVLSRTDAQEIYSNYLKPALSELNKRVEVAKRDLRSTPFRAITGLIGAITIGWITGLIGPEFAEIASAIGIGKFGPSFLKDLQAIHDEEKSIEMDKLYFLWKVQKEK